MTLASGARAPLAVIASVLVFACLVERAGLLTATAATSLIATLGAGRLTVSRALVYALCLALAIALLFVIGLGQPIPLIGTP